MCVHARVCVRVLACVVVAAAAAVATAVVDVAYHVLFEAPEVHADDGGEVVHEAAHVTQLVTVTRVRHSTLHTPTTPTTINDCRGIVNTNVTLLG